MNHGKFKYIKKPSWFGDEGPIYEHEELNETLKSYLIRIPMMSSK